MRKIYPKISEGLNGEPVLRKYIDKYQGTEIQYFHKSKEKFVDFEMAPAIHKVMEKHPELKEITVHPPLSNYDIEQIILADKNLLFKLIKEMIELSNQYKIEINMVLHSNLNYEGCRFYTIPVLKEATKILKGTRVKLLLENLYMFYSNELFAGLQTCRDIDSENINVCIDMCHLYCRANMHKMPIEEFLKIFLDKELCKKYVHQIHFADTKNNDGYIEKSTHGRTYDTLEKMKHDLELLKEYGMENKIIVTEVSEDDYSTRVDQLKTIKLLEEYYNQ